MARPLPLPAKPSIAVLPFTNLSGETEQNVFADGLTEDLILRVEKPPSLPRCRRHAIEPGAAPGSRRPSRPNATCPSLGAGAGAGSGKTRVRTCTPTVGSSRRRHRGRAQPTAPRHRGSSR
ncbi:hypothetical protein FQV39_05220 [Bosea sp. F3-2]|nr:hypothetical protein FQV39_05220 [Bosea sp. F3-2]